MHRILSLALFCSLVFACGNAPQEVATEETTGANSAEMVEATFGAEFDAATVMPANNLLASYDEASLTDTVATTLRGTVNEVCQAKGCWMTIATGTDEEMMVKFKDYGFFMPKDISGREVVMHGKAFLQLTPVEELQHYAEDAGKTPEEIAMITEPKRELHFLADGVQLIAPGE
ncbi:DUF4920 domain-containing protein [Neolewinella lacunae]|uniref:DUF4920 domain-containing protein n=1 Tax=Neolewinella lacunae TaxID=1517758 RepID=A0A923PHT1_9BACT|nr:DUF4920 domain-containing protein [Neolewinella lacunae]MBC6992855.1 DUF4920 domain-containing protein [Neolewinella lacunae]MDN3633781.1 DUF4920 domain-containing protein [Neolewinella lacunae]